VEKITYNIPNIHRVIKLLANVYSDPRDALTEFLINSLDANADIVKIIIKKGKINRILIKDNGYGMDNSEMKRIVKNIGNSIKVDPHELRKRKINFQQVIGHMGIGILGYQSFCKKVTFISKSRNTPDVWKMILEADRENAKIDRATLSESNLLLNPENGTTIILYDIDYEIMKLFSVTFLRQYLERNLTGILRKRHHLKITILDNKTKILLKPLAFTGIAFPKTSLFTKSGKEIGLDIFILPEGTEDDIRISTKGKVVVKEIIRLPEFQHSPWADGVMHGNIEANFLDVAPTRSDYVRNSSFHEFLEALTEIEHDLKAKIEAAKKENDVEKRTEILKKLNSAVSKALYEMHFDGAEVNVSDSSGKLIKGRIDGSPPPVKHTLTPRKEKHFRVKKDADEYSVRARKRRGLNLKWEHLGNPNLHSSLGEGGLIIINEDADDYKNECLNTNTKREMRYLSKLISKELAKFNNPLANTDDVMENALALELKILRHLNL
jgi:hypothetical protein